MKDNHILAFLIIVSLSLSLMSCEYKDYIRGSYHFGVNYVYHGLHREIKQMGISEKEFISHQNQKLNNLGIGWIRSAGHGDLTSLNWANIEKADGQFDFRLHDTRVIDAQEKCLYVLGTIDFSSVPEFALQAGKHCNEEKYLRYLHAVVERYDGDGTEDMEGLVLPIKFWEIGNETLNKPMFDGTSADYAHILDISYKSIKENDPESYVLIGGWVTGGNSPELFQKSLDEFEIVLKNGGGVSFDIMNFHQYQDDCDFGTYQHVQGFKNILAKFGLEKPFWMTETNTKLSNERKDGKVLEHSLEQQSQDIIKRFVTAFDAGVDVVFWHGLDDSGENNPGVGFFNEEGVPKPIFYNLQHLIETIGHFTEVERLQLTDNDYVYIFALDGCNEEYAVIAWTEQDNQISVDLSNVFGEKNVHVSYAATELGQKCLLFEERSAKNLKLTNTPIFVTDLDE